MPTEFTKNIRNILNHPWKREIIFQDRVKWNKIWASLDTFDDTIEAINFYKNLEKFDAYNGGYLYIYGVLQALNLQQDAINNLNNALFGNIINWKVEYPDLYLIREHRNNSIGHPTNRGNNDSFHMIGRYSINKNGFTLASYFPKTGNQSEFVEINLIKSIELQTNLLKQIIEKAMKSLENEYFEHKKKFVGSPIKDLIPNTFDYHISKLYEHNYGNNPIVEIDFNIIKETIENIKIEIEKRYFSLSALQGIELNINMLDYLIERLQNDLIDNKITDKNELTVFIQALNNYSNELFEMIEEIDREFLE